MDVMTLVGVGAAAGGVVLGAAGVTKLVDPAPTVRLFGALGVGAGGAPAARTAGAVELALALWLLSTGNRWAAAATALAYVVLVGVVLALRHRSPSTPCGCFGQWSGPPAARHVVVNALGAATCALSAATDTSVAPPGGTGTAGVLAWWAAVAIVAVAGVLALGGRRSPAAARAGSATPPGAAHVGGSAEVEQGSGRREVRR